MLFQHLSILLFGLLCHLQAALAIPHGYSRGDSNADKKVVHFGLNLTWEDDNSVGFTKPTIFMNGQSPGPALELTVGDSVEFVVYNQLPFSTTVHFHGITQLNTPWSDGVAGVSQRPIQPGSNFTYRWTADEYGTYFYHAHHRGQIHEGLYGAIIIHPSKDQSSPFGLIGSSSEDIQAIEAAIRTPSPIFVADWTRWSFEKLFQIQEDAGIDDYCPDATIINGKGSVYCPGVEYINSLVSPLVLPVLNGSQYSAKGCLPPIPAVQGPYPHNFSALDPTIFDVCEPTQGQTEVITVDPSLGWASLNFVSTASISTFAVSIDEHQLWIYAVDGTYIVPQLVDQVIIPNGNRYSALVKLDKPVGDYTIRVTNAGINQIIGGYATLSYVGSTHSNNSTATVNYAGVNVTADFVAFNEALIAPFVPSRPAPTADTTFILDLQHLSQSWQWTLDGNASYSMGLEDLPPLIYAPDSVDSSLVLRTKNGTWVDLIVKSTELLSPPHPIHKHSNKVYVLGSGIGEFNYTSVAEAIQYIPQNFNLVNPPLRDGFLTPPAQGAPTWVAIRYQVINPGAFLIHCHIQTHFSGGMALAVLDGVDVWPTPPPEYCDGRNGS